MAKGTIQGGVCGFVTTVRTSKGEGGKIKINIETDCPNFKKVADELTEINPYDEIFKRLKATMACDIASKHSPHPSCIVPSGILKTIEVEAGLALPKNAEIKLEK